MYTIIETPTFKKDVDKIRSEDERGAFCTWIASNPKVGDVIPGSGGCRKVRWTTQRIGKRGGVRVIYFTELVDGEIWLLVIYRKNVTGNIPSHLLKTIVEVIQND